MDVAKSGDLVYRSTPYTFINGSIYTAIIVCLRIVQKVLAI